MKILVLGNNEITHLLRNAGHLISSDPDDKVDAVVSNSVTYRLAPDQVPLFILLSGGPSDWAVKKDRPQAHFYTNQQLLVNELAASVCETVSEDLPANAKESIVLASYANKGGVGKTTTAVSIATVLASKGVNTVLCDFDYGGASLATYYDLNKYFKNYLEDSSSIDSSLYKVNKHLYVLPSPTDVLPVVVKAEQVIGIIENLKSRFQAVVCDTPPGPWEKPYMSGVFGNADRVYAVVNQSKFSIEETKIYAPQLLLMGVKPENISIIVNQYHPKYANTKEIERAFCAGFKKGVKDLPTVCALIPQGFEENLTALQKGNVINREIWDRVVQRILREMGRDDIVPTEAMKKRFGFFKR